VKWCRAALAGAWPGTTCIAAHPPSRACFSERQRCPETSRAFARTLPCGEALLTPITTFGLPQQPSALPRMYNSAFGASASPFLCQAVGVGPSRLSAAAIGRRARSAALHFWRGAARVRHWSCAIRRGCRGGVRATLLCCPLTRAQEFIDAVLPFLLAAAASGGDGAMPPLDRGCSDGSTSIGEQHARAS
jgi:hypothetical protein